MLLNRKGRSALSCASVKAEDEREGEAALSCDSRARSRKADLRAASSPLLRASSLARSGIMARAVPRRLASEAGRARGIFFTSSTGICSQYVTVFRLAWRVFVTEEQ
jgi:hypothetical protein